MSSYDFLIAFIISFQNMHGYMGSVKPTTRNNDHLRSDGPSEKLEGVSDHLRDLLCLWPLP